MSFNDPIPLANAKVISKALPSKSLFHLGVDTEKDLIEANEIAKKF